MSLITRINIPHKAAGDTLTAAEFNHLATVTDALAEEATATTGTNETPVRLLAAMAGKQLYVIDFYVG